MPKTTHPLYSTWREMIRRCTDPKSRNYRYYGGRGITPCERWLNFDAFCADVSPRPSKAHTLDRIDNDGPYEKANCRWSTQSEQMRNSTRAHKLVFQGKSMTLTEWAEETGIGLPTLSGRLQRGWTVALALTTPARVGQRVRQRSIQPLLDQSGLARSTFYTRLAKGWTLEEAAVTPRHQGQRHVSPKPDAS